MSQNNSLSSSVTSSPTGTNNITSTSTIPSGNVSFSTIHHINSSNAHPINFSSNSQIHPVTTTQGQFNPIGLTSTVIASQQQVSQVRHHSGSVNSNLQFHAFNPNFKDTRWLTLEVCREFQRAKCQRSDSECKFAHPPSHVEVTNGKVIACYDSLKVIL